MSIILRCMLLLLMFWQGLSEAADDPTALYNRGEKFGWQGEYSKALNEFDAAIKADPKLYRAYNGRAQVLNCLGDFKDAMENCNQCIVLEPKFAAAYANRATSFFWLGQYKKAKDDARTCEKVESNSHQLPQSAVYIPLAFGCEGLGELDEALAYCDKSISLNPNFPNAYAVRAKVRIKQRDYKQAIADCTKALSLFPRSPRVYETRAVAYEKLGNLILASSDRNKAKLLNDENRSIVLHYSTDK